jgi:hypothetical protein
MYLSTTIDLAEGYNQRQGTLTVAGELSILTEGLNTLSGRV